MPKANSCFYEERIKVKSKDTYSKVTAISHRKQLVTRTKFNTGRLETVSQYWQLVSQGIKISIKVSNCWSMHSSVSEDVTANINLAQASRGYQLAMLSPM